MTPPAPSTAGVIIFTTPGCPHCAVLKSALAKFEIEFREVDVLTPDGNAEFAMRVDALKSVPVVMEDGVVIIKLVQWVEARRALHVAEVERREREGDHRRVDSRVHRLQRPAG